LPGKDALPALDRLADRIRGDGGVAEVSPPFTNTAGTTAIITIYPSTAPQDARTDELVHRLRSDIVPAALQGSGVTAYVGGVSAFNTDFAARIAERLPWLIGVVIALSFLLLMVVFRSLLVPLKAAVMNLLSIGAAYGVIVAMFQWGWLKGLLGTEPGPIEAWAPMMLFAILFGLSMDYEVFLLSRVREEYVRSRDNATAVADGLATTARVITAAAAIMITVFLSFVLGFDQRQIKLFGLGLAVAIFVDATLVRMVLVPATMELLGDANWWLPRWLDRLLPHVSAEGSAEDLLVPEVGEAAPAR
jgi:RND superfamily putative drug exporter